MIQHIATSVYVSVSTYLARNWRGIGQRRFDKVTAELRMDEGRTV
jgi:hypothetical protein